MEGSGRKCVFIKSETTICVICVINIVIPPHQSIAMVLPNSRKNVNNFFCIRCFACPRKSYCSCGTGFLNTSRCCSRVGRLLSSSYFGLSIGCFGCERLMYINSGIFAPAVNVYTNSSVVIPRWCVLKGLEIQVSELDKRRWRIAWCLLYIL